MLRVVFVRHGEKRRGEVDPELTSAGRRMASEAGAWLASRGIAPDLAVVTPTRRTRQTLEELLAHLPPPPVLERHDQPESALDWEIFTTRLARELPAGGTALLVGHHPTQHMLLDTWGPPPVPVPRHHLATALVLERGHGSSWRFVEVWPGRST